MGEYFHPPPGQGLGNQERRQPEQVGLDPVVVTQLGAFLDAHRDESKTRDQRQTVIVLKHILT
jgi:hypothetical protein